MLILRYFAGFMAWATIVIVNLGERGCWGQGRKQALAPAALPTHGCHCCCRRRCRCCCALAACTTSSAGTPTSWTAEPRCSCRARLSRTASRRNGCARCFRAIAWSAPALTPPPSRPARRPGRLHHLRLQRSRLAGHCRRVGCRHCGPAAALLGPHAGHARDLELHCLRAHRLHRPDLPVHADHAAARGGGRGLHQGE
jgi:hypothetical protein